MPSPDTTVALSVAGLIAAAFAYAIYQSWRDDINDRRQERLSQRRNWLLIDRCERYSMRHTVDTFIAECLEEAA